MYNASRYTVNLLEYSGCVSWIYMTDAVIVLIILFGNQTTRVSKL